MMQPPTLLLVILASGVVSQLQGPGCKPLPKDVKLGPGIPMRAEDIPIGCADFEVLVGPYISPNPSLPGN